MLCKASQIVAAESSRVGKVQKILEIWEIGEGGSLLTTSSAQSVRLVVTLSEAGSSLGYNDIEVSFCFDTGEGKGGKCGSSSGVLGFTHSS